MSNLAVTYHSLGHRDKAIEMMTSVIDLSAKIIGPDHPDTLTSIDWLDSWTRISPSTPQHIDATGPDETTTETSEGLEEDVDSTDVNLTDVDSTDDEAANEAGADG